MPSSAFSSAVSPGHPLSRFSRAELHRLVVERGVSDVSATTIARWLREDALKPWQYRSRVFPTDPDVVRKADGVAFARLFLRALVRTCDTALAPGNRQLSREMRENARQLLNCERRRFKALPEPCLVRDEGLLRLFFGELVSNEELLAIVQRRRVWYEGAGARLRGIAAQLGEVEGAGGEVLRPGSSSWTGTRPGGPIWSVSAARERA